MTGGKVPSVDISTRAIYTLYVLALVGCVFLISLFMRGLFLIVDHLRWVP